MLQSKNRNIAVGEQRAFEYWLRTGRTLRVEPDGVEEAPVLRKYNHNHDPQNGQFTSGPGEASPRSDSVTIDLRTGVQRHRNGSVTVPLDPPKPAPRQPASSKHYLTDTGISVPAGIEPQVNAMAKDFREKSGRSFMIMSGNRTPEGQANAMYEKFKGGHDGHDYSDQKALREIRQAYREGETGKKSKASTVAAMAAVIRRQVSRGVVISKHMRGLAVDIRTRDLTNHQRQLLSAVAASHGARVHPEGIPRHLHLQF